MLVLWEVEVCSICDDGKAQQRCSFNIFKSGVVASVCKNRFVLGWLAGWLAARVALHSSQMGQSALEQNILNKILNSFSKDDMIRQMALEQKKKLEEKRKGQVLIKSPMF